MNAEESLLTPVANLQVSGDGHKLPEQAKFATALMPREISILDLMYQWQPMGIRVVVNLPFISNNKDFLFCIRNGPFIPIPGLKTRAQANESPFPKDKFPITSTGPFFFNNTRNVIHGPRKFQKFPEKNFVYITHYDAPPILATLASSFRRWRGDMQYRIRTVAGFATQGYIFAGQIKNAFSPISVYDENKFMVPLIRSDDSYREVMQNSYVMADTSMFRHLEITSPYEYPTQYYDQFAWLSRRINPNKYCHFENSVIGRVLTSEPHGDNWIVVGLRGNLAATHEGAQVMFELEYRACEGFQFADPALVYVNAHNPWLSIGLEKIIPSPKLKSDGFSHVKEGSKIIEGEAPSAPTLIKKIVEMVTPTPRESYTLPPDSKIPTVGSSSDEWLKRMRIDWQQVHRNPSYPIKTWSEFYRTFYSQYVPQEHEGNLSKRDIVEVPSEYEPEPGRSSVHRREKEFT